MPPTRFFQHLSPHLPLESNSLYTADVSCLSCSGSRISPLPFGTCSFEWPFQLAPFSVPILGANFLRHHNLPLDQANQKVISGSSPGSPTIKLTSSPLPSLSLCASLLSAPRYISNLLSKFPDVLSSDGFTASPPRHQVCSPSPHLPQTPLCLPSPAVWILINSLSPMLSSLPWRRQVLSAVPLPLGPLQFTWSRRRTKAGGPVGITNV